MIDELTAELGRTGRRQALAEMVLSLASGRLVSVSDVFDKASSEGIRTRPQDCHHIIRLLKKAGLMSQSTIKRKRDLHSRGRCQNLYTTTELGMYHVTKEMA